MHYVVDIVLATRQPENFGLKLGQWIDFGASPRASIHLAQASKAYALVQGRDFVLPQDIKSIGFDVLRHRIMLNYEAEVSNVSSDDILSDVFDSLPVP